MSEIKIKQLGKYKIGEQIGDGGMGKVFKGYADNQTYAIKIIDKKFTTAIRLDVMDRFEQEIESLKQLSHPNIVHYFDSGEDMEERFLVMEYVPGQTLKYFLKKGRKFSIEETAKIMIPILSALQHCHEQNLVHRDIKPENIIMMENKNIKLIDFGIVRTEGSERTLLAGSIIGTPPYMSPEQLRGREQIDALSDIYSSGIVLYELLTGKQPFTNLRTDLALKEREKPPQPPSTQKEGIPSEFDRIFTRSTHLNRQNRYQSAKEFAHDIAKVLDSINIDPKIGTDFNLTFAAELKGENFLLAALYQDNRFSAWHKTAQSGDVGAQWLTGLCYLFGCGVKTDMSQATSWLRSAADTGHQGAQYRLGFMLEKRMVESGIDGETALGWYKKAASEPGYPLAHYRLGLHKWLHAGDEEDDDQTAVHYFRKAAEKYNYPPASSALATHYEYGWDVPRDEKTAIEWYTKAAKVGDARAQAKLGFRHRDGKGVEKDDEQALQYITQASEGGDTEAQVELAGRYREGKGVARDQQKAKFWLRKAAERLYPPAVDLMHKLYPEETGRWSDQRTTDQDAVTVFETKPTA